MVNSLSWIIRPLMCSVLIFAGLIFLASMTNATTTGPYAYIPNYGSDDVSVIDTQTNMVIATIPVGIRVAYPYASYCPYGVSVNPDRTKIYVTNTLGGTLSVIDAATNNVTATIPVGISPNGVAVTPDGTKIYVTNCGSSTISVIDATTNKVIATIPLEQKPYRVAASPDGTKMYIVDDNGISVIDTATNTVTVTTLLKGDFSQIAVTPDGSKIYVTNPNFDANLIPKGPGIVSVIDATTNKVTATIQVGYNPEGIAVTPDGSKIYVANEAQGTVSVIDASTNKKIATIHVDDAPMGVAATQDGTKIYVANSYSNTVSVIEVATNKVIATISVGDSPRAIGLFITPVILKSTTSASPTSTPSSTASASPTQTPFVGVEGIGAVLIGTVFCILAMRKKR